MRSKKIRMQLQKFSRVGREARKQSREQPSEKNPFQVVTKFNEHFPINSFVHTVASAAETRPRLTQPAAWNSSIIIRQLKLGRKRESLEKKKKKKDIVSIWGFRNDREPRLQEQGRQSKICISSFPPPFFNFFQQQIKYLRKGRKKKNQTRRRRG